MPKTVKYEVVRPERCTSCDQLIGQISKTRAWLMPPEQRCDRCEAELAALMLKALYDDLHVIHVLRDDA
jgi:hypothetical protein